MERFLEQFKFVAVGNEWDEFMNVTQLTARAEKKLWYSYLGHLMKALKVRYEDEYQKDLYLIESNSKKQIHEGKILHDKCGMTYRRTCINDKCRTYFHLTSSDWPPDTKYKKMATFY